MVFVYVCLVTVFFLIGLGIYALWVKINNWKKKQDFQTDDAIKAFRDYYYEKNEKEKNK